MNPSSLRHITLGKRLFREDGDLLDYDRARTRLEKEMRACRMCPVACGARRADGERGACRVDDRVVVSSAFLHYGEEDVLVGIGGSGTIFLAGCNLHCVYCQNHDISQRVSGRVADEEDLVATMLALQRRGAHNINFVSPTHFSYQLLCAVIRAREEGLKVPVVWNSGGYDSPETLAALDGWIEIYMPDAKYADAEMARRYSGVEHYPDVMKAALREMHRQVGDLDAPGGIAVRGLLVRHLVLPGDISGARDVVDFLAEEISENTYLNLMAQYRPCHRARRYPELNRGIDRDRFLRLRDHALSRGLRLAR